MNHPLKGQLTHKRIADTQLEESFWVAFPGKDLTCFVTNRLTKSK